MNKKKIIEIAITVVAFGASAYVLYSGLHESVSPAARVVNVSATKAANVLPYGVTLDFSILEKRNFEFGTVHYETINTSTEVGVNVDNLIQPQTSAQ